MIQNLLYEKLKDSLIKAKRSEICKVEDIYLWNDYKALAEYIKKCDKVPFIYSVLEQENKKIIKEGYHFYNRVGYILSNIKYDSFPSNGIDYEQGVINENEMGLC